MKKIVTERPSPIKPGRASHEGETNLHAYPSAFKYESRILKETKSIADAGLFEKVFVAAIWEKGLNEHEDLDCRRTVWRTPLKMPSLGGGTLGKLVRHLEWMVRVYLKFKTEPITFINCHSLSVLPLGIFFKVTRGTTLIYDTHELETETQISGMRKRLSKIVESQLIKYVDDVVVVSNSIANWYKCEYNLTDVVVVRNIPYMPDQIPESFNILKQKLNLQSDDLLFIYQGLLDRGRGIDLLLRVFSQENWTRHIVFMGYGPLEAVIKEWADRVPTIHFHPAVRPEEVLGYTRGADVGLCLIEDCCLSYRYSLPNKMFEYIAAGVPVVVSDFPDMGRFIDEHQCGWKVIGDEGKVRELVGGLTREDIAESQNKVLNVRKTISWHGEAVKLLEIYRGHLVNTLRTG